MHAALIKLEQSFGKSILSPVNDPWLTRHHIELWLKRDDLLHPIISGNKWRKLKYNLDAALSMGADTLISMGGAYSNHLHALAYLGKILNLKTVGVIRGERPPKLGPTLLDMAAWGMELRFISRSAYRDHRNYKNWQDLPGIKPNEYWLPEGGATHLALKGVAELVTEIDMAYDTVCVACGTGTTLAGIIPNLNRQQTVLGFSALKNADFLPAEVQSLLNKSYDNWQLYHDYHYGGFAKANLELIQFMTRFEQQTLLPLEPIYTAKLLCGLYDLIAKGNFKQGQRIIALHTGGLQGNRSHQR